MSDIPEDVMKAAKAVAAGFYRVPFGDEVAHIARAILQERERCAQIAEAHDGKPCSPVVPWEGYLQEFYDAGQMDASISIASAIRGKP